MMRIAYVINSLEGGGAAQPVPAVVRVLERQGAEVEVFALTRRDGRGGAAMEAADLMVNLREGGETDHLDAFGWLDAHLALWAPHLIWTSLTRATLLGQLVGLRRATPVVSWQHNAFLKPANRRLLRTTQKFSALWVADSHSVAALTAERLGVPETRLGVWPLFAVDPAAPQARPWRPGEALRLGSLGRLHPAKGYDVLIGALARLSAGGFQPSAPLQLEIAGEGAERERLAQMIVAANLTTTVRLAGYTARPEDFLAGLHLYLQPSRREGLCIAAHQAMQAGLPVVASAVGEMPRTILSGQTGFVVEPADPAALAEALARQLQHPERLAAMGAAARDRVNDLFSQAAFERAGQDMLRRAQLAGSAKAKAAN